MEIFINGQSRALTTETTVTALLAELGMQDKPVVVELNGQALAKSEHDQTIVSDGARLELIILAAGG